jgi:hypothetical protein
VELDTHLATRPARRFGTRERWQMFKGENASVVTRLGQVDVVQQLPGLPGWDRPGRQERALQARREARRRDRSLDADRAHAAARVRPRLIAEAQADGRHPSSR